MCPYTGEPLPTSRILHHGYGADMFLIACSKMDVVSLRNGISVIDN